MINRKRIMFVFGTRPEAIKMAPVILEIEKYAEMLEPIVVSTGQHRQMLDQVMRIFEIEPAYDLQIMEEGQSLTSIVTKSMLGVEDLLAQERPDMLLVQGDTATAFAAGLMAYYHHIPLGHIEAGLRTFDKLRPFPEELNRKLLASLADLHFPPTLNAMQNLISEQVPKNTIFLTGNTVIDAFLKVAEKEYDLREAGIHLTPGKKVLLATAHRRENFGRPMESICKALLRLAEKHAEELEIVVPVHKNPRVRETVRAILGGKKNVILTEPLDYFPFVHLMKEAYLILTDSGGVQEEAPTLGKPVLVLREKTERPEAVAFGGVKLVGLEEEKIFSETETLLADMQVYRKMSTAVNPYGDGKAAGRIVQAVLYYFGMIDRKPEEFRAEETLAVQR